MSYLWYLPVIIQKRAKDPKRTKISIIFHHTFQLLICVVIFNPLYDSAKSELLKFVSKSVIKIVILIGTFSQNILIILPRHQIITDEWLNNSLHSIKYSNLLCLII